MYKYLHIDAIFWVSAGHFLLELSESDLFKIIQDFPSKNNVKDSDLDSWKTIPVWNMWRKVSWVPAGHHQMAAVKMAYPCTKYVKDSGILFLHKICEGFGDFIPAQICEGFWCDFVQESCRKPAQVWLMGPKSCWNSMKFLHNKSCRTPACKSCRKIHAGSCTIFLQESCTFFCKGLFMRSAPGFMLSTKTTVADVKVVYLVDADSKRLNPPCWLVDILARSCLKSLIQE